jgi:hypothetical protein
MAIQSIKEIINNKGYLIGSSDRKIFETGDLRSFFGFSSNDAIEFIVYDANDNQLPQLDGKLVRYIPLSTENISDYILIPDGTLFQKYQLPKEYFIDVERLLREAGYDNGIFKTQITLINKRVGSEYPNDKLWISEISPSRTEVRIFTLNKSEKVKLTQNLKERFDLFKRDGNFREDVINDAITYIEKINPSLVTNYIKENYGDAWFSSLVNSYKIQDFDKFITNVHSKFLEGCIFEFTNRISDITNINYGTPTGITPNIALDISEIKVKIQKILINTLNYYLLPIDEITTDIVSLKNKPTLDEVDRIYISKKSDIFIRKNNFMMDVVSFKKPENTPIDIELNKKIKEIVKNIDSVVPDIKVTTPVGDADYVRPGATTYTNKSGYQNTNN